MRWLLAAILCIAPVVSRADDGAAFEQSVDSVVAVFGINGNVTSRGTGVVVGDRILSAWHVIENAKTVAVIYPCRDRTGAIIDDPAAYRLANACVVIAFDARRDLALLRPIDPNKPRSLTLASASPSPGSHVFTIGAGSPGTMWTRLAGVVRQVCQAELKDAKGGRSTKGEIVFSTIPSKPGYSGGPILNSRGEIVGILLGSCGGENPDCHGISCSEVTDFINEVAALLAKAQGQRTARP